MFLIRLGLDDGSLLTDPNFVLDASEVELIRQRTETFNQIIEDVVSMNNHPIVDVNAMFDAMAIDPPVFPGISLTLRFLGGFFSLDGTHPSNIGYALLANRFIETINEQLLTNIPRISETVLSNIVLTDPFVDKDRDSRVRGRFGAGLLETLGSLLGISGDKNDFISDLFLRGLMMALPGNLLNNSLSIRGKTCRRLLNGIETMLLKCLSIFFLTRGHIYQRHVIETVNNFWMFRS